MPPRSLKIAIGLNLQKGPFGGGNRFGHSLRDFLNQKDIQVISNLNPPDIDLILLTETRPWLKICAFGPTQVLKYLQEKPDTLFVFRINECAERKGSKPKILNKIIIETARKADQIVFISHWLRRLFLEQAGDLNPKSVVIQNGADQKLFNDQGYQKWNKKEPLRIVTHHWGSHLYKGFDIYLLLDRLITQKFKNKIHFTLIGNQPAHFRFQNSKLVPPQDGADLAYSLKQHHIYLTASRNEPAGMHHIEGALCGLPILYRQIGALPEYCQGYGIPFRGASDFEEKLLEIIARYDELQTGMKDYNHTAIRMSQNYYTLFLKLLKNKTAILKTRKSASPKSLFRLVILPKLNWLWEQYQK